ncbi:MAG: VRR-NUC domain-containing protein [Leptospiraceae bacterium]|nr:VRR-NUC domain-containing protein [Leptospiraceae bacterium]
MVKLTKKELQAYRVGNLPEKRKLQKHRHDGHTFSREEDILHYEVIKFLKLKHPDLVVQSNHLAGKSFKHTGRKFNPILRNVAALNGTKGMPDIIIFKKVGVYSGLAIELKKPGGKLSSDEKVVLDKIYQEGFYTLCAGGECKNIKDAIVRITGFIESYLNKDSWFNN